AGALRGADAKALESMDPAVCVVLASGGYPRSYETGLAIEGLESLAGERDLKVFHAGTRRSGDVWSTAGGRVLGVTARAATLGAARERAYAGVARIRFAG